MRPLIFANQGGNQEHVNFTDWKSVEDTNSPGSSSSDKDELDREKGKISFTPKPKKKKLKDPKKPQDWQAGDPGFDTELHRDMGRTNYGGDPFMYSQPFDKPSPSTREFMYAPGDHGISSSAVDGRIWVKAECDTLYQDDADVSEMIPKKDGMLDREGDSNFSQKPKTWRFKKKDRDLQVYPGSTNGEEEPPDWSVVEMGEHMLPLTSTLRPLVFVAKPADFKIEDYTYSMPKQIGEGTKSWKAFRTYLYKVGGEGELSEEIPRYIADFYIIQPQGKRAFVFDPENIGVSYYDVESPTETGSGISKDIAFQIAKYIPGAVKEEAIRLTISEEKPVEGIPQKRVRYEKPKEKGETKKEKIPEDIELENLTKQNKRTAAEIQKKKLEERQKELQPDPTDEQMRSVKDAIKKKKLEKEQRKLQEMTEKEEAAKQKAQEKGKGGEKTEEIPVPAKHAGGGDKGEKAKNPTRRPSVAITPNVAEELKKMGITSRLNNLTFTAALEDQHLYLGDLVIKEKTQAGQSYEVPVYKADAPVGGKEPELGQPLFMGSFAVSEKGEVVPESLAIRRDGEKDILPEGALTKLIKEIITTEAPNLIKKIATPEGQEKVEKPGEKTYSKDRGRGFNVLTDPLLETTDKGGLLPSLMTQTEKLFTTIKTWPQDTLAINMNRVDKVAQSLLEQGTSGNETKGEFGKSGKGDYFSWKYLSDEDVAKLQESDAKGKGFSRLPNGASLTVTKKPAWSTQLQEKVQRARVQ